MEYEKLTEEQQEKILEERLTQAEADHFNTTLSLEAAKATGVDTEGYVDQLKVLDKQIALLRGRLK